MTLPFIERLRERQPDGTVYRFMDIWWTGTAEQLENLSWHVAVRQVYG